MKIPTHIKIKENVVYEIVYVDTFPRKKGQKKTYGECHHDTKQIKIALDQSEEEMKKTIVHEVFHCWEYEYKIKISHKAIHQLEVAVYNFLVFNGYIE